MVLAIGLLAEFSLESFILKVVAPLLPVFVFGIRQLREQRDAAARVDQLRAHAESLWANALTGHSADALAKASRDLQDEIYSHRRSSPLIFDSLYQRLKRGHEQEMNIGAESLVREAQSTLRE
jgi:hypothetical protein